MPTKNTEKFYKYLAIILLPVAVLVLISVYFKLNTQNSSTSSAGNVTKDDVSTSDIFLSEATRMKSYMNESVNPCDDFYSFACGGFKSQTKIGKDEFEVNQFTLLHDKTEAEIRLLLEEPISPSELRPFALAKVFYKSCMDTQTLERLKFQPLLNVLKGIGGWPVLLGNNWKPTETSIDGSGEWSWTRYVIWLVEMGLNNIATFIKISLESFLSNRTDQYVMIDRPLLRLDGDRFREGLTSPYVFIYHRFMVDMAVLMGAERDQASMEMLDTVNFEIKMATCMYNVSDEVNYILNDNEKTMTINEMNERYPSVPIPYRSG